MQTILRRDFFLDLNNAEKQHTFIFNICNVQKQDSRQTKNARAGSPLTLINPAIAHILQHTFFSTIPWYLDWFERHKH